jgi:hypothetical protein
VRDLLGQIFVYSPARRITAEAAALHPCFRGIRGGKLYYGGEQWIPPEILEWGEAS